jgi:phage RecT family recombinase
MVNSVASELVVFENTLKPLAPKFEQALGGAMPVDRLMRSIIISVERTPRLLECDRQTLLNSSMSAACLGLEVDGVTGQAFFIPYGSRAQLIIGYKGMNTLAARSGFTVSGEVVRDGDTFDYELGDRGFVRHKPKLGNKAPIIAAWATASALGRPPIISVMGIDDLMAVKMKSPGAKKSDSPWNDVLVGFPAMCAKTAKRRLSRSMPLNADPRFHMAAALDEAFEERGRGAWIDPGRGLQIEGEAHDADAPLINHEQRSTAQLLSPSNSATATSAAPPSHPASGAADELSAAEWDVLLGEAAKKGESELSECWASIPRALKPDLKAALDRRHKPTAASVQTAS